MEYKYKQYLNKATSQINFGEEETALQVTVTNAERIAQLTEGKVYVSQGSLQYVGGFRDSMDAARWAIQEAAEQKAIATRGKEVTVDFEALEGKVAQAYAKDKAREEREIAERKLRDQLDEDVNQLIGRLEIPDVTLGTYWGAVEVRYQGKEIKRIPKAEFVRLGRGDIYGMVLAHLQDRLEKAEEARAKAEAKVTASEQEILKRLYDAEEIVKITAPSERRLKVIDIDEDC